MAVKAAKIPFLIAIFIQFLYFTCVTSRSIPSLFYAYDNSFEEDPNLFNVENFSPQIDGIIQLQEESTVYTSLPEYLPFYVLQDNAPWNILVRVTMASSAYAPASPVDGKASNNNEYIINWMSKKWPWMVVSLITLILSGIGIRVICHCYFCRPHDGAQARAPPTLSTANGHHHDHHLITINEQLQLSAQISSSHDPETLPHTEQENGEVEFSAQVSHGSETLPATD